MVGRGAVLADLLSEVERDLSALVLLAGDAGIGKTRMATEVVSRVAGRLVLTGTCLPMSRPLPLLPFVQALDSADSDVRRALGRAASVLPHRLWPSLAALMPRHWTPHGGADGTDSRGASEGSREQLFQACRALLAAVADDRPVLLVVEDIHWADEDTLDLLTLLAATVGSGPRSGFTVLATLRTDEARVAEHISEWLERQRHDPRVREVHLAPLSQDEVGALAASLVDEPGGGGDVDQVHTADAVIGEVFARAQGNPFFTEQLLAAVRDGTRLPARLAEVLMSRVRATSTTARQTLTFLAVVGRPLSVLDLARAAGLDEPVCVAAVAELDAARLVARERGSVRPRHALLSEAVVASHPGLTREEHRRVAGVLQALGDDSAAAAAAEHWRATGDEAAELTACRAAGARAWRLRSFAEAGRWYARVYELAARHPTVAGDLSTAEEARRWVRSLDRSGDRAEATLAAEVVLEELADWPDKAERFRVLSHAAHLVMVDDGARGLALLEALLDEHAAEPPTGSYAHALSRVGNQHALTDSALALGYMERALAIATRLGDDLGRAHALARASGIHLMRDEREAAEKALTESLAIARQVQDGDALLDATVMLSDSCLKFAEYEDALAWAREGLETANERHQQGDFLALILLNNAAEACLHLGRTAEAGRLLDPLTAQPWREADNTFLDSLRANLLVRRGSPDSAVRLLLDTQPRLGQVLSESRRLEAEALAEALLWVGEPQRALQTCEAHLRVTVDTDDSQRLGVLLSLAARAAADGAFDDRVGALTRLDALRSSCRLDPFVERATLPRGVVDGHTYAAEVARADGAEDPGPWLRAADAWARLQMPHDAAYCWWRAAECLATAGDRAALRDLLPDARAAAEEHLPLRQRIDRLAAEQRIPLQDGTSPPPAPAGLTPQEIRVLTLVADGLTNGQIGAALFISPKTASVHVSNLMRKIGASNRAEAAAWAARHGLQFPT